MEGVDYTLHEKTEYGRFLTDNADSLAQKIATGVFHDVFLKEFYDKYLTKDSVFVEVGTHIGSHTVYCAPKCKLVYAFEPTLRSFYQLCANLLINNINNVNARNIGLSDKIGNYRMNDHCLSDTQVYGWPASASYVSDDNGDKYFSTLDYFSLNQVDFIKIDAEDMDYKVIVGGLETIKKHKPVIAYETQKNSQKPFEDLLSPLGYKFHKMSDNDYLAYI